MLNWTISMKVVGNEFVDIKQNSLYKRERERERKKESESTFTF